MKVFKLFENVGQQQTKCVPKSECNNNGTGAGGGPDARHQTAKRATSIDDDTCIVADTQRLMEKRHRYSIENFLTGSVPSAVVAAAESVRSGLLTAQHQYPALDMLTPCLKDVLLAAQLFGGKTSIFMMEKGNKKVFDSHFSYHKQYR